MSAAFKLIVLLAFAALVAFALGFPRTAIGCAALLVGIVVGMGMREWEP